MISLHEQVFDYLITLVENGENNDKLPSHSEIRSKFNVSAVTVRNAITRLEDEGLIFCRQGKGCFVHKVKAATGKIKIFMIIPCSADVTNEFVASMWNAAREKKYHVMLFNHNSDEIVLMREIRSFAPNAVVWVAPTIKEDGSLIERLAELDTHLMLFNRVYEHPKVNYISGDFTADGTAMGEMIFRQRPKNVLYVGHNRSLDFSDQRYRGILLRKPKEIEIEVIPFHDYQQGTLTAAIGDKLRGKRFDAIICAQGAIWGDLKDALGQTGCRTDGMVFGNFNALPAGDSLEAQTCLVLQPISGMGTLLMDGLRDLFQQKSDSVKKIVFSTAKATKE